MPPHIPSPPTRCRWPPLAPRCSSALADPAAPQRASHTAAAVQAQSLLRAAAAVSSRPTLRGHRRGVSRKGQSQPPAHRTSGMRDHGVASWPSNVAGRALPRRSRWHNRSSQRERCTRAPPSPVAVRRGGSQGCACRHQLARQRKIPHPASIGQEHRPTRCYPRGRQRAAQRQAPAPRGFGQREPRRSPHGRGRASPRHLGGHA